MPGAPTSEMADELRTKARDHPTVVSLVNQLDETQDAPSDSADEGLYVDTAQTPGITVNGELRVSVARVHSVTDDGCRLVGQVQAVRVVDHPLKSWELRLYTHVPENFHTNDYDEVESWFLRVLDLHYEQANDQLDVAPEIPA